MQLNKFLITFFLSWGFLCHLDAAPRKPAPMKPAPRKQLVKSEVNKSIDLKINYEEDNTIEQEKKKKMAKFLIIESILSIQNALRNGVTDTKKFSINIVAQSVSNIFGYGDLLLKVNNNYLSKNLSNTLSKSNFIDTSKKEIVNKILKNIHSEKENQYVDDLFYELIKMLMSIIQREFLKEVLTVKFGETVNENTEYNDLCDLLLTKLIEKEQTNVLEIKKTVLENEGKLNIIKFTTSNIRIKLPSNIKEMSKERQQLTRKMLVKKGKQSRKIQIEKLIKKIPGDKNNIEELFNKINKELRKNKTKITKQRTTQGSGTVETISLSSLFSNTKLETVKKTDIKEKVLKKYEAFLNSSTDKNKKFFISFSGDGKEIIIISRENMCDGKLISGIATDDMINAIVLQKQKDYIENELQKYMSSLMESHLQIQSTNGNIITTYDIKISDLVKK